MRLDGIFIHNQRHDAPTPAAQRLAPARSRCPAQQTLNLSKALRPMRPSCRQHGSKLSWPAPRGWRWPAWLRAVHRLHGAGAAGRGRGIGLVGDVTDTVVILVIVVLNAVIGFAQAWRADQAMAALASWRPRTPPCCATAGGRPASIGARRHRAAGGGQPDPADLRLIEIAQLQVWTMALTGESVTVPSKPTRWRPAWRLGDRINMAFKGTTATHGRARGLVVATGMRTELGKGGACSTA